MLEIYADKNWSDQQLANMARAGSSSVTFYPANTPSDKPKDKKVCKAN